jgi:hypothetical protein
MGDLKKDITKTSPKYFNNLLVYVKLKNLLFFNYYINTQAHINNKPTQII